MLNYDNHQRNYIVLEMTVKANYNKTILRLKDKYGSGIIEPMLTLANSSVLAVGNNLNLVNTKVDEVCVRLQKKSYICTCNTFVRLNICCHMIAIYKFINCNSVNQANIHLPSKSNLVGNKLSGKKPGEPGRKGGRAEKPRPFKAHANKISGQYTLIRRTIRHRFCNGCKGELSSESYTLRHCCAIPFPFKNVQSGMVEMRTGTPSNHHFHARKDCVNRSAHHKPFDGVVTIDPTLHHGNLLKQVCRDGNLVIKK